MICVTVLASRPSVSIDTGHDAADVGAEPARAANGIHRLAEQISIGQIID
jgi:hypothetical protein